jgi:hypothetical protein
MSALSVTSDGDQIGEPADAQQGERRQPCLLLVEMGSDEKVCWE